MTSTAAPDTRFKPKVLQDQLPDIVRAVTTFVNPDAPATVTQAQFDLARADAGFPHAPVARQIAARLHTPWRWLLALVHDAERDERRLLAVMASDRGRKNLLLEHALTAMRTVAAARRQRTLTRSEYRETRNRIVAGDRRAYRHGGQAHRQLPGLEMIETALRHREISWDEALRLAGLRVKRGPSRDRRALSPAKAVAAFAKDTGYVPSSQQQLLRWAKAHNVSVQRARAGPFAEAAAKLNARRVRPLAGCPANTKFTPSAAVAGPVRQNSAWTKASIIAGLVKAIGYLRPGETLGQRELKRIAKDHRAEGIPSYNQVRFHANAHGATFPQWRAEALQVWAAEQGGSPEHP